MKKLIKDIIKSIVKNYCKIFPYRSQGKLAERWNRLYSFYISLQFSQCGNKCHFGKFRLLREPNNIIIGDGVYIGSNVVIELYSSYFKQIFTPHLKIGNNSCLGDDGHITCINRIIIGDNVRMGRKVFITDNSHGASVRELLDIRPNLRPLYSKGPVIIEDNVWVGEMVCIMPGVTIGYGSILGANSVITHDVPPYCVVGGNPARILKNLSE